MTCHYYTKIFINKLHFRIIWIKIFKMLFKCTQFLTAFADEKSSQALHFQIPMLSSRKERIVPRSELSHCLSSLCFLRSSSHGAKYSCLNASSALILYLGFTVKHLSTRSMSELGIIWRKSRLLVFILHHSRLAVDGKDSTLYSSCRQVKLLNYKFLL